MTFGGTIDYFIQAVFNYPTLSDAYKYAAYDGLQRLARRHAASGSLPRVVQ
jgi:NAD(P) transhydrogenase